MTAAEKKYLNALLILTLLWWLVFENADLRKSAFSTGIYDSCF
jgi:hypothetical protein